MSRSLRSLVIAVAAFVSCTLLATAAQAITVSPAGSVTATSGATTLTLTSLGTGITCTSSSIAGTINSAGVGTVPTGSARYNGCALASSAASPSLKPGRGASASPY